MKKAVKKKSAATTRKPKTTTAKKKVTNKVEPNTSKQAGAKQPASQGKVMDVAKPGSSMPSSTTRPIITTHRQLARDPMVSPMQPGTPADVPAAEKPTEESATPTPRAKKNRIEPISNDLKTENNADNAEDASTAPEVSGTDSAFSVPLDEKSSLELVQDKATEEAEKPADTTNEAQPPVSEEKSDVPAVDAEAKPEESAESAAAEPAQEEAPAPDEASQDAAEDEKPGDDAEPADDAAKDDDKNEGDMDEVSELAGQAAAKKAQKAAEDEAVKRLEVAQALVNNKMYNVPINAVHKRHTARVLIVLLLVVVLLAGLVAAVDAGLLDVGVEMPFDFLPDDLLQ